MSFSKAELFSLALSASGSDFGVSDPEEQSREAALCRLWFDQISDQIIAAAPWPSVRAYARLALIDERDTAALWQPGAPAPHWRFVYGTPSDLLHPYYLATFERFEYLSARISTNAEQPILYYNRREEDLAKWDQGLKEAVIHALASRIARPLTGSAEVVQEQFQLAQIRILDAQVAAANTQDMAHEDLPDWLQARGTSIRAPDKYFHPFQMINAEKVAP